MVQRQLGTDDRCDLYKGKQLIVYQQRQNKTLRPTAHSFARVSPRFASARG